jgi:hypothetical protein
MQHLTTVTGSFHARLLAARLGSEDVLVELRGLSEGPYPLQGLVEVWVEDDRVEMAREILLGDAVDDALRDDEPTREDRGRRDAAEQGAGAHERARHRLRPLPAALALGVVILLVIVVLLAAGP